MRRFLAVLVAVLFGLVQVVAKDVWSPGGQVHSAIEGENRELDKQISTLRTILESRDRSNLDAAELLNYWRAYALMLQTKDNNQHYGGGILQPEALRAFDEAISLNEKLGGDLQIAIEMHYHKGILLETIGRGEEAYVHFKTVRDLAEGNSDRSIATSQMANVLALIDRTGEALDLHLEALREAPWRIEIYLALVECYKELKTLDKKGWSKLAAEMEAAVRQHGGKHSNKSRKSLSSGTNHLDPDLVKELFKSSIYWALFDAYDHAGDTESAWEHLETAHEIEWEFKGPKHAQQINVKMQTEQIKSIFQPGFWMEKVGHKSMEPIFIIGMMRCGSTLLETMLHSHGEVWGLGENSVFNGNLPAFREELVSVIAAAQRKIETGKATGHAVQTFDSGDINSLVTNYGNFVVKKMRDGIEKSWSSEPHREGREIRRLVDKMVFNYRNIGFLHMVFPKALMVHIVRDPLDTLLSCYRRKFDDNGLEWALDIDELTLNYAMYLEIMHHFRRALPGRILDVRYEQLVTDPETVLRKICTAAEIEFDPNMLQFKDTVKKQQTHSRSQVRQGLYSSHVGGWRKYQVQLRPIIASLKTRISALRKTGALPFIKDMNWDLDPKFDYDKKVSSSSVASDQEDVENEDENDEYDDDEYDDDEYDDDEYEDDDENDDDEEEEDDEEEDDEDVKNDNSKGGIKSSRLTKARELFKSAREQLSAEVSGKKKGKGKTTAQEVEVESDGTTVAAASSDKVKKSSKASKPHKEDRQKQKEKVKQQRIADYKEVRVSPKYIRELRNAYPNVPRSTVSTGTGPDKQLLWDLFAAAHAHMGKGEFGQGVVIFDKMIGAHIATLEQSQGIVGSDDRQDLQETFSTLPAHVAELYRGMGTGLALMGQLQYAQAALDKLLDLMPEDVDGLTRRAEVLTALGDVKKAKVDLDVAVKLAPRPHVYRELLVSRGMAEFRNREFRAAYKDFQEAKELPAPPQSQNTVSRLWNYIGKCENEFSEWRRAIESQNKAIEEDPTNKEAHYEKAIALISASIWRPAIKEFERVIELDPSYKNAHGYRGLLYQNLGRPADAVESFDVALQIDPNDAMVLLLKGVCTHALGRYAESVKAYNRLMEMDKGHYCVNRREAVIYSWVRANTPLSQFSMDDELNPYTKMGINKQTVYGTDVFNRLGDEDGPGIIRRGVKTQQRNTTMDRFSREAQRLGLLDSHGAPTTRGLKRSRSVSKPLTEEAVTLVLETQRFATWLQLNHHGFLINRRQHRQFALSVMHMAQSLRSHLASLIMGTEGVLVSNAATSSIESAGFKPSKQQPSTHHVFGWRDLYDIAGLWRQVAEPMDAVWWIDRLPTPTSFKDRIGLNTFMVHGSNKVIRYYSQLPRAQALTRQLMLTVGFYNPAEELTQVAASKRAGLANTTTLKGLHAAANEESFFVITHVKSLAPSGQDLAGIRITLAKGELEGWDFSICVPSTPERFAQYEEEIHYAVERTISTLRDLQPSSGAPPMTPELRAYHVKRRALELFYYWANFGAFTRGTSATGYASMYAVLVAGGLEITAPLPKGVQLDWEAFFSPDPETFVRAALSWLQTRPLSVDPDSLPQAYEVFTTMQTMVDALNYETAADSEENQFGQAEAEQDLYEIGLL